MKDRWHNSTPDDSGRQVVAEKSLADQASALAYIIWKVALNKAINLHAEDFRYDDDRQRIGVITEFVAFQIQHVDRLSHHYEVGADRAGFIQALCGHVAEQMQDNLTDIAGPRNYKTPFVALLNRRFSDYARLEYREEQPGYGLLRYLGHSVLELMGEDQTNRWVIDQIIEIDAPDMAEQITRSAGRLFGWPADQ
ncbi:hypothetical protein AB833_18145 [Chromatiales bacterium (ex Bugula neritina AB1)]|nr:hypothetical protein AB833_18145 [Chromatiales bacterium (ex Bugula neritina AB1)]